MVLTEILTNNTELWNINITGYCTCDYCFVNETKVKFSCHQNSPKFSWCILCTKGQFNKNVWILCPIYFVFQIFLMEKKKWIMLNCQRTFTLNSPIVIVTVVVLPFVNAIVIVTVSLLKIFHGKSYLPKTNILLCFLVSFKT